MPKIIDNTQTSRTHFAILRPGDVFRCGTTLYMKTQETRGNDNTINAIDLTDFHLVHVPPITEVVPLYNTELVINPDNDEEDD